VHPSSRPMLDSRTTTDRDQRARGKGGTSGNLWTRANQTLGPREVSELEGAARRRDWTGVRWLHLHT
jgi:hypothetical protein